MITKFIMLTSNEEKNSAMSEKEEEIDHFSWKCSNCSNDLTNSGISFYDKPLIRNQVLKPKNV